MITITNSNQGTKITVNTWEEVKRTLRKIVKHYGGRAALKGIYISHPKSGEWFAQDITL